MRDQSEWVELIEAEVNVLVGSDKNQILEQAKIMLTKKSNFELDLSALK